MFNDPALDSRLEGTDLFSAPKNTSSNHYFAITKEATFNGIEFFAWAPNAGDKLSLCVEYNAGTEETPSWKLYKKYGKAWNIFPNNICRIVLFPADLKVGGRLKFVYENKSSDTPVQFSVNLFKYSDEEKVDVTSGAEGESW